MALLDSQIDELYQLPPSEFTAARNALAKMLSGDEAKRVRHLEKPTVVPWAINELFWKERPVYDRLLETGRVVREAQVAALSGKSSRSGVQGASDAHRKALAEAVRHAVRLASAAGVKPDHDALARMLEALSLASTLPAEPGRMTELLRPAGFEALTGVTPAPKSPASAPKEPSKGRSRDAREAKAERAMGTEAERQRAHHAEAERKREANRRREEQARRRAAEAEVKRAERTLERAQATEAHARRDLEHAQEAARAAAQKLSTARLRLA